MEAKEEFAIKLTENNLMEFDKHYKEYEVILIIFILD